MDKILVFIEDKEVERKIIRELSNDYFFNQTYIDEFNYISIINQYKPQIIILSGDKINYLLLSKLCATSKLIIYIKNKSIDLTGLKGLDNFYVFEKNNLNNILDYMNIISKNYRTILELKTKIQTFKDNEEESRYVKRAKLLLMKKGMSEEEAYKYILDYSMKKRITKKETSMHILNE